MHESLLLHVLNTRPEFTPYELFTTHRTQVICFHLKKETKNTEYDFQHDMDVKGHCCAQTEKGKLVKLQHVVESRLLELGKKVKVHILNSNVWVRTSIGKTGA